MQNVFDILAVIQVGAAAQEPNMGRSLLGMSPLLLMLVGLYFFMIRPQKKKEQQLKQEIESMKVGDKIITIGGIVGKIVNISADEVTIASSVGNSLITFKKNAINSIQKAGGQESVKKS